MFIFIIHRHSIFVSTFMIFGSLLSVNQLKYVSMNNQECKVRLEIVNANSNAPLFYPFSIKTSKCSGSCNNVNDLFAKLCIPNVVKNLDIKNLNLISRTNEMRHKKWHGTCKSKCWIDASVCNNKPRYNEDNCMFECKELIEICVCGKGSIWNRSNCE